MKMKGYVNCKHNLVNKIREMFQLSAEPDVDVPEFDMQNAW